eukprot:ctg_3901.g730
MLSGDERDAPRADERTVTPPKARRSTVAGGGATPDRRPVDDDKRWQAGDGAFEHPGWRNLISPQAAVIAAAGTAAEAAQQSGRDIGGGAGHSHNGSRGRRSDRRHRAAHEPFGDLHRERQCGREEHVTHQTGSAASAVGGSGVPPGARRYRHRRHRGGGQKVAVALGPVSVEEQETGHGGVQTPLRRNVTQSTAARARQTSSRTYRRGCGRHSTAHTADAVLGIVPAAVDIAGAPVAGHDALGAAAGCGTGARDGAFQDGRAVPRPVRRAARRRQGDGSATRKSQGQHRGPVVPDPQRAGCGLQRATAAASGAARRRTGHARLPSAGAPRGRLLRTRLACGDGIQVEDTAERVRRPQAVLRRQVRAQRSVQGLEARPAGVRLQPQTELGVAAGGVDILLGRGHLPPPLSGHAQSDARRARLVDVCQFCEGGSSAQTARAVVLLVVSHVTRQRRVVRERPTDSRCAAPVATSVGERCGRCVAHLQQPQVAAVRVRHRRSGKVPETAGLLRHLGGMLGRRRGQLWPIRRALPTHHVRHRFRRLTSISRRRDERRAHFRSPSTRPMSSIPGVSPGGAGAALLTILSGTCLSVMLSHILDKLVQEHRPRAGLIVAGQLIIAVGLGGAGEIQRHRPGVPTHARVA